MSYLFDNQSDQQDWASRYEGAQLPEDYSPDFYEPNAYLERTLSNALTPARIGARSIANLGIAADAIPTAIGTYTGIENPWWHQHVTQSLINTRDKLTPDPQTTHTALQVVDQFAGMASDFALTGGNPLAFSTMQGAKRVTEEIDKGKSLGTALDLGTVDFALNKAFTSLPVGLATKSLPLPKWLQGSISGAGIGAGLTAGGEAANQAILNRDGYPKEAQQHDWSNPATLGLGAAFAAVFGGLHPHVLPSHQDALLTVNDAHAIQNPDGLEPTHPKAAHDMVEGMNQAIEQLYNGEPVTSFIPVSSQPDIPENLIALAGNRLSRGERKPLDQQKKDLEYKLKQIEEGDYTQHGLDLANEQLTQFDTDLAARQQHTFWETPSEPVIDNPRRLPARKLAAQRKTEQAAQQAQAEAESTQRQAIIDSASELSENARKQDAQPHQEKLDRLNKLLAKDDEARAAHAEISRIEQQHLLDNGFIRNPAAELLQKQINHEVSQLSDAYDQVNKNPTGKADDPLVMIKPEDMEAVAVARGGWKGFGDIEVKGAGWGIAKFIWRHGKKSKTQKELQIEKEDVLEFPNVIRDFHPSREASPDGSRGREWRVNLNGRTIVYADNLLNGRDGRHLVTIHAQDPNKSGHDHPLSEKRVDAPASSGKRLEAHTGDTQPEFLQQTGQEPSAKHSVDPNNNNASKNDTPQISAARELLQSMPDKSFSFENSDGTIDTGTAAELMAQADAEAGFAEQSDTATQAAINCYLKWGDA